MRSCWVISMWQMSHKSDMYSDLPDPHQNGWLLSSEGSYSIDWEDPDIQSKVERNIHTLMKGCRCKQKCEKRCGCRKNDNFCGPGCECQGCTNLPIHPHNNHELESDVTDDSDHDVDDNEGSTCENIESTDEEHDDLETEVITDAFEVLTAPLSIT